jgi:sugar phosphate isomerase/epimerase
VGVDGVLIGAMNHPACEPLEEIAWMAEAGLEFVDLTLEPPAAAPWRVDLAAISQALAARQLEVVGHSAYYLPIGHPFEEVRRAATAVLAGCLEAFAQVGARWMNVHPDGHAPLHDRAFVIAQNLKSLATLIDVGRQVGVGVMVENVPAGFNTPDQLGELLDPLPELGLHLDIGHAQLRVPANTTEPLLQRYGDRLRHVHLHDNNGDADQHLPLGTGVIDTPRMVRALRACGYDGTITLEVFSRDEHYLKYSRDVLRRLWNQID